MGGQFRTIRVDLTGDALFQYGDILRRINASIKGVYSENELITDIWKNGMLAVLTEVERLENENKYC